MPTTEAEFTITVERHRPALHRHCVRLIGPTDAEDALQEALICAWRARATQTAANPRGWLYAIATNACYDAIARRGPTSLPLEHEAAAPSEHEPDTTVINRETVEIALLTAIQHLSPVQHAAFLLRDVLSFSAKDTAAALQTSVPAANSALQRARQRLRTRLYPTLEVS